MRYSPEKERIVVAGLAEIGSIRLSEVDGVTKRRKIVACASHKLQYGWLRIDPCASLPHVEDEDVPVLSDSKKVSQFLHDSVGFTGRGVEYVMIVCTNAALQPMAVAVPHKGGRASSMVDIGVVLQAVILSGASSFIVAHNHPSGRAEPSEDDITLTKKLKKASELVGLRLLDHIVLTDDPGKYMSMEDKGIL